MKFYYIWDAYCGWSYGFNSLLKQYLQNHSYVQLKMISGGLFLEETAQPIGNFPHIPTANQEITKFYGVSFGQAYETVLSQGELVMDSLFPATAFALMREKVASHAQLDLAIAIQQAFYQDGKDLREISTYQDLARRFGLNRQLLRQDLEQAFASHEQGQADIDLSDLFGVTGYPTLILEHEGQYAIVDTALPNLEAFEAEVQVKIAQLQRGES